MLDFLKRFFPKKGETMDDLDDEMYGGEPEDPIMEDEPPQPQKHKLEGLLIDFFRKFKPKPKQEDDIQEPVLALSKINEEENIKEKGRSFGLLEKINSLEGAPKYVFLGVATAFLVSSIYVPNLAVMPAEDPCVSPAHQVKLPK